MSDVIAEKLGAISDRLARMEERMVAADRREDACDVRVVELEHRLADMERARWWMTGAATLVAAFAGWFAKTFTAQPGGH